MENILETIGNLREGLEDGLLSKKLMEVIKETRDKYPKMKKYYIVYAAKLDKLLCNVIRDTFKVVSFAKGMPKEMLGAICFIIDDSSRKFGVAWNLPYDYGDTFDSILSDKGSRAVDISAKNLIKKSKK